MMIARFVFTAVFCWTASLYASEPQGNKAPVLANEALIIIRAVSQDTSGPLLVYLYNEKDTWLKVDRSYRKIVFWLDLII